MRYLYLNTWIIIFLINYTYASLLILCVYYCANKRRTHLVVELHALSTSSKGQFPYPTLSWYTNAIQVISFMIYLQPVAHYWIAIQFLVKWCSICASNEACLIAPLIKYQLSNFGLACLFPFWSESFSGCGTNLI